MPNQKIIATMSREKSYPDGSGPKVKVSYNSEDRLGQDNQRYARVRAVGSEDIWVDIADIPFLVEALQEAADLDEKANG